MPELVMEDDRPKKVSNAYSEPIQQLIDKLNEGTPKRWAIPVKDDDERKRILRMCRDAANYLGYSAGERQLDDDDPRDPAKFLLIGVREKAKPKDAPAATPASA